LSYFIYYKNCYINFNNRNILHLLIFREPFKKSDSIKSDFIIKISSIGLIDSEKLKLKGFELSCKNIKYLGDSFNNIDESDFVVIKNQGLFAFQDIRFIYAIFHKFLKYDCPLNIIDAAKDNNYEISKKIIRFKFFNDFDRKSQINLKSFDNYIVPLPEIDFASYYKNVLSNNNIRKKYFKIFEIILIINKIEIYFNFR